ncbi:MAG: NAD(P)/FAD-dependent oxidoreductase [Polyangiaceae bacterium]|nr:NAD(P)/FAD-dependent oxidoreductase [Polyangiaceae bacterium]MCE7888507.1 NAD(P)/FAD-dependent oxidoreductase [Sorangiineae bacterium PRO1]MCL4751476.1 NAD(P)/FAD-dependent oxidoreductase [Myxococcales bacterium]
MTLPRSVEVLIIGGGPAGSATALFLAHHAPALTDRVLVVEKERFPREKFCAGGVGARADKLLGSIGVTVDVPSVWLNGIAFRAMGRTTTVREQGIGRVVRRVEFDHELARIAQSRGVPFAEGVRVLGLTRCADGYEVETSAGPVRARVVVGADGVQSVVRRALGFESAKYRAQAIEVDTEPVESDLPRDVILFDASHRELPGYYWDFPTLVNGREMVVRGVYLLRPTDSPAVVEIQDLLAAELEQRGLDLGKLKKKRYAELAFDPHVPVSRPHVLLVGESAGIDPVTGEGIAQAIYYGSSAAKYLARKLAARDLGFEDWPSEIRRSSIGRDLMVRTLGVPLFYGAPRANVEAFLHAAPEFIRLGCQHFGGKPWSKAALARAGARVLAHTARYLVGSAPKLPDEPPTSAG